MRETRLLILAALADGSEHGCGIIARVAEISGGRTRLRPGALYAALEQLRADSLIGVDRDEIADGRPRRYYRLTPAGRGLLAAQTAGGARQHARPAAAMTRLRPAGGVA
jgi:DNA-binding PadR family transcriptional regulator